MITKRRKFLLIMSVAMTLFSLVCLIFALEVEIIWERTNSGLGGDNTDDIGYGIAVDEEENIYVVGQEATINQRSNIWIAKYDKSGNLLFTRTHNNRYNLWDVGRAIALDPNKNIYVGGYEVLFREGYTEYWGKWLRKYDSKGNILWTISQDRKDYFYYPIYDIAVDQFGNVYVIGNRELITGWGRYVDYKDDAWVAKYDTNGKLVWEKVYKNDDYSVGRSICVDRIGNIYVTGSEWVSEQYSNIWVKKLDNNGNTLWIQSYNGYANKYDGGRGICVDDYGNVYVTGYETVVGQAENIWVRKYDPNGVVIWTQSHNGKDNSGDEGNGVCVDKEGNVYVVGTEYFGYFDRIWVRIYNSSGEPVWTRSSENESIRSYGNDIAIGQSGNFYITGILFSPSDMYQLVVRRYKVLRPCESVSGYRVYRKIGDSDWVLISEILSTKINGMGEAQISLKGQQLVNRMWLGQEYVNALSWTLTFSESAKSDSRSYNDRRINKNLKHTYKIVPIATDSMLECGTSNEWSDKK